MCGGGKNERRAVPVEAVKRGQRKGEEEPKD